MQFHDKPFIFLFACLTLAALSCQTIAGAGLPDAPTLTPQPPDLPEREVLLEDDFENKDSGWPSQRDANGIRDYEQGGYRMTWTQEEVYFWANAGRDFSDVQIDVDVTKLGGPDDSFFGLICRNVDFDQRDYSLYRLM